MPQGTRSGEAGGAAALALRAFRGNGFDLLVPEGWEDVTLHTLVEQTDKEFPHWLRILVDEHPAGSTAVEFGEATFRAVSETTSGCHVLRSVEKLDHPLPAAQAELRWSPTDGLRIYQRYLFFLLGNTGFTLSAQMNKKSRTTVGPVIDRILRSFRPVDPVRDDPPVVPGHTRFRADRFVLDHPPNWADRTIYTLAEPADRGFRRNVVVRREVLEDEPFSLEHLARAEADDLAAAVPGLEILERTEIATRDRKLAARLLLRRPVDGGAVEQAQLLAPRARTLYVVTVTFEAGAAERVRQRAMAVLDSFRAEAGPEGTA